MKAVATALVLIAGAAVVLWYGNTLNSWVLGGLIGGLAALLLSIPISLTLFSYLSRRHEERLQADALTDSADANEYAYAQEEMSLAQVVEYSDYPRLQAPVRGAREVYVEEYSPVEEPFWDERDQEEDFQHTYNQRQLPAPRHPRQTPNRLPVPQQRGNYSSDERRQPKALPAPIENTGTTRRTTKRMNYPGFPGYHPTSSFSQSRSAALRTARQEAVRQHEEDREISPTHVSRRIPSVHPDLSTTGSRPSQRRQTERAGRTVEATPSQSGQRRALPSGHRDIRHQLPEHIHSADFADDTAYTESQTEYLRQQQQYTETGPIQQHPQSGQLVRRPHIPEQRRKPDTITGSMGNPMVRRAPYMYEDDPIRQEFSQQINGPITRRSSRRLHNDQSQGEE